MRRVTSRTDLPTAVPGSQRDGVAYAEEALFQAVRESALCVAAFDLSSSRIVAASTDAISRLGLTGVDFSSFDFVQSARDPDAVRRLVELICAQHFEEWSWRSLMQEPDGRSVFGYATGRVVSGPGSRMLCLARYEWPSTAEAEAVAENAARLLGPSPEQSLKVLRREERRLAAHVARLERHLDRIGHEVESSGRLTVVSAMPQRSDVPGLDELSERQWEVATRLVRGERVPTIARGMFLSPSTVRNHLSTIYRKVGVSSQAALLELLQDAGGEPDSTPL